MVRTETNVAVYSRTHDLGRRFKRYRTLLLMLTPGIAYFILFHYVPMYGVVLAFKDLNLVKGILHSPWVGLTYFQEMFSSPRFFLALRNTFIISLLKLFFGFFPPIIFALLLTEIRNQPFKRITQTISYLPHFISWVILAGIIKDLVSLNGPVNFIWERLTGERVIFLAEPSVFRGLLVSTEVWKGFGWGSIIYLASISALDPNMYEAARIDGANRFQQAMRITIPSLIPVITVLLILSMSGILSAGFDQIFNLYNPSVLDVADIIDTYVYRMGIQSRDYSLATAAGLFKSAVALVMIVVTNMIAKAINDEGYTLW